MPSLEASVVFHAMLPSEIPNRFHVGLVSDPVGLKWRTEQGTRGG
jgi:hypothetical protein